MVNTIFKVIMIGVIVGIAVGILGAAVFSWNLETSTYLQGLTSFLSIIYYVLPIQKLSPILVCFIALMSFRIVIATVKTLWQILPFRAG